MRKRRNIVIGAAYHVCARINRQELALENNQIKRLFLDIVAQAKLKYNFRFRNFCIMGNHVHLDIQPSSEVSISKIMQWILSVFAIRYNKVHGYKGHVWYDRFKSKAIQTIEQFINTFKYISNNPVRAKIVVHPLHYAFSGITFYKKDFLNYQNLLDPPEESLLILIDSFLAAFDKEKIEKPSNELSFINKKPGRKKRLSQVL